MTGLGIAVWLGLGCAPTREPAAEPGEVSTPVNAAAGARVEVFGPLQRESSFEATANADGRVDLAGASLGPGGVAYVRVAPQGEAAEREFEFALGFEASASMQIDLELEDGSWRAEVHGAQRLPLDEAATRYQPYLDEAIVRTDAYEDDAVIAAMIARHWAELLALDTPSLRTLLLIRYASEIGQLVGPEPFVELFSAIEADDPLWPARAEFVVGLFEAMGDRAVARDYATQLLASQRDPGLLAAVRQAQLTLLREAGYGPGLPAWDEAWNHLASPELAPTEPAAVAWDNWDTARPFESGRFMPALSWPRLDGEGELRTQELLGQAYLVEMWATWCRPCVAALPELHRLHALSKTKLAFISLSIDEDPTLVEAFRREHHPMPWTHVVVPRESIVPGWEIPTIPVYVLVGADGVILAVTRKLGDPALIAALKPFASTHR